MNLMTLNIRGIREAKKFDWIRNMKFSQGVDFMGIQETRVNDFNSIDIIGC